MRIYAWTLFFPPWTLHWLCKQVDTLHVLMHASYSYTWEVIGQISTFREAERIQTIDGLSGIINYLNQYTPTASATKRKLTFCCLKNCHNILREMWTQDIDDRRERMSTTPCTHLLRCTCLLIIQSVIPLLHPRNWSREQAMCCLFLSLSLFL